MSKTTKFGCVVPLILVIALGLASWVMDNVVSSSAIRALPASASGVREYYHDNFTGDYVRVVKANMTESDYHTYARSLGLTQRFDPARDDDFRPSIEAHLCGEAWWDPPNASSGTYFRHTRGKERMQSLRFTHGTAYFLSCSW
jgi:hypothetical protein